MKIRSTMIILLLLSFALSACSPVVSPAQTIAPAAPSPSPLPPTLTPVPSPTPEPGKVLLVAPQGSDARVQALLGELAGQSGMALETLPEVQPGSLGADTRVVVLLSAPGNLAELVALAPQVQFMVMAGADLPPAGNLSVIRLRAENQAFLGGFISVLLSVDWRSAGLLPADGPLGANLQDAFQNGGQYFCGVCAPGWPLGQYYPQAALLPAASDGPAWQAAAAGLFDTQKVDVFYISPEAARPEVYSYLNGLVQFDRTVLLLGGQLPPDELRGQWAATVRFDTLSPLRQHWPDLVAGQGGLVVEAPLLLEDANPAVLSEGKLRLVDDLIEEIRAGRIYPFTLPQE